MHPSHLDAIARAPIPYHTAEAFPLTRDLWDEAFALIWTARRATPQAAGVSVSVSVSASAIASASVSVSASASVARTPVRATLD